MQPTFQRFCNKRSAILGGCCKCTGTSFFGVGLYLYRDQPFFLELYYQFFIFFCIEILLSEGVQGTRRSSMDLNGSCKLMPLEFISLLYGQDSPVNCTAFGCIFIHFDVDYCIKMILPLQECVGGRKGYHEFFAMGPSCLIYV